MFVCVFVHICVYSFHMCFIRFGAYPNHMHIQIIVKPNNLLRGKKRRKKQKRKIQQQRVGTNVRVRGFNAGLLARSQLHSKGPATGQLDQGFLWFSLVPEQMLSRYPNSTLHYMLPMQPSQW
jgi:hypothetical protein